MTSPTLAAEYNVDGADGGLFAKTNSVETVTVVETSETNNINRSKDSAFVPPSFGSPSSNTPGTGELLTPNISGVSPMQIEGNTVYNNSPGADTESGGTIRAEVIPDSSIIILPPEAEPSESYTPSTAFTLPDGLFYEDGSLGRLKIPTIGVDVKVYEDESLESLAKGAGHFKFTSAWDGNVGIAGHNRGVTNHFGQIHTLSNGDTITYTTKAGTRTYAVYYVGQIHETDFARLERTDSNIITLVTCVRDIPELRWCVQAKQI